MPVFFKTHFRVKNLKVYISCSTNASDRNIDARFVITTPQPLETYFLTKIYWKFRPKIEKFLQWGLSTVRGSDLRKKRKKFRKKTKSGGIIKKYDLLHVLCPT